MESHAPIEPTPAAPENNPSVWGPAATLLWGLLIAIVFLVVQVLATGVYLLLTVGDPGQKMPAVLKNLEFDGTFLAVCSLATMLVCAPVILGIAKLKRGSRLRDYFGLKWPRLGQGVYWSAITVGFCLLNDAIFLLFGRPTVPEFMSKAYSSASPRWLLWLALIIAAPVLEEICFRGFLFKGLAASRLRWTGATIVTAVLWAAIHLQYDWPETATIFFLGLVLGTARALTGSIPLVLWLHALVNILATVQVAIALRQL